MSQPTVYRDVAILDIPDTESPFFALRVASKTTAET